MRVSPLSLDCADLHVVRLWMCSLPVDLDQVLICTCMQGLPLLRFPISIHVLPWAQPRFFVCAMTVDRLVHWPALRDQQPSIHEFTMQ